MAALSRDRRRLHPCRSAADYHDPLGRAVRHRLERTLAPLALAPGGGIQHAGHFAVLEQAAATVIDSGALGYFTLAAFASFGEEEGVSKQRAHHADHVGRAISEHAFSHAEVDDAADDEDTRPVPDDLLGALAKWDHETVRNRHGRRRLVNGVIAAAGDAEEVEQPGGGKNLQLLLALLLGYAGRPQEFVQ